MDSHNKEYSIQQSQQLKHELEIVLKMIFFRVRREETNKILLNDEEEVELNCNSGSIVFVSFLLYSEHQEYEEVSEWWLRGNYTQVEDRKKREKQVVSGSIGKLCLKKANCMLLLAAQLKIGRVNLHCNSTNAISYFNPYKDRAEKAVEETTGAVKKVDDNIE